MKEAIIIWDYEDVIEVKNKKLNAYLYGNDCGTFKNKR